MSDSGRLVGKDELRRLFPEAEAAAQHVAQMIGSAFPPGYGFALLAFSFGEGGYLTHVSNCERDGLVKALRECADTIEKSLDSPPGVVGRMD